MLVTIKKESYASISDDYITIRLINDLVEQI